MTGFLSLQIARARDAALALLLACSPAFAQPAADPAPVQNSIKLVDVIAGMPAGAPWLKLGYGYFCNKTTTQTWNGGRTAQALPPYSAVFKTELEKAGYKVVTPGEDNLFDTKAGAADYEAAAVISDAHIDGCMSTGAFLTGANFGDVEGSGAMKVDWQIYSPIRKEVVARVSTTATAKLDQITPGGVQRLLVESFAANVRELAAGADLRTAVNAPKALTKGFVMPGQQSKIVLAGNLKAGNRPIADAVGSVVTILVSGGSGSGVLVSNDGHVLTNAHVVGDEKEVRIRWSDGIETLAQVVRVAKDRDVAILKTSSRDRAPLTIKRGAVSPGQKVYAIGSPKGKDFQGTVSSGVVSAGNRIFDGLRYIQSDTVVSFGSSGGALLDETGALIGLTDLGVTNAGMPAGLNLFIPIGDAVDFLSLDPQ